MCDPFLTVVPCQKPRNWEYTHNGVGQERVWIRSTRNSVMNLYICTYFILFVSPWKRRTQRFALLHISWDEQNLARRDYNFFGGSTTLLLIIAGSYSHVYTFRFCISLISSPPPLIIVRPYFASFTAAPSRLQSPILTTNGKFARFARYEYY